MNLWKRGIVGDPLKHLDTPAVLLDLEKLESNLAKMQRRADDRGVALRPHAKTHKSIEIGRRQLALGAVGLTVATVDEALVFTRAGIDSITLSRPLVSACAYRRLFAEEAARRANLSIVVDSEAGIDAASEAAVDAACTLGVFVKIDVGLRRCGVDPSSAAPLQLARLIGRRKGLELRGILSHAGQVYAVESPSKATEIAETERTLMMGVRDTLLGAGISVPEISVGSTPTVLAAATLEGVTEIRPGNYAFLDLLPVRVGVVGEAEVAFTVLATIISKNTEFFVTDAGSKTLTSDTGGHGMASADGFGAAYPSDRFLDRDRRLAVAGLSEEHGKLARAGFDLPLGSKVRIIPNHSCPVANLCRGYTVLDGDQVEVWPVDAAGCSR